MCLGVLCSAPMAFAQAGDRAARVQITEAGSKATIDCADRVVQITGATNDVTLTGNCPRVEVTGAGNTVDIELADRITVTGAFNRVTWQRPLDPERGKPRITVSGAGSSVTRVRGRGASGASDDAVEADARRTGTAAEGRASSASGSSPSSNAASSAPANARPSSSASASASGASGASSSSGAAGEPSAPASASAAVRRSGTSARSDASSVDGTRLTVLVSGVDDEIDCDSREVTVVGSNNTLRLQGACPLVRVTGSDNKVTVGSVGRMLITGSQNTLTWTRGLDGRAPGQTNTGSGNVIRQASAR